jgi:hypothetical protein
VSEVIIKETEHEFALGCHVRPLSEGTFLDEQVAYRALYIFPFHVPALIELTIIGDMAELTLYRQEQWGEDTETFRKKVAWMRTVWDALDAGTTLPDTIPDLFRFKISRADLSATQLQWFKDQISTIPLETLRSDDESKEAMRDGTNYRIQKRAGNNPVVTIDVYEDHRPEDAISRSLFILYQMACSTWSDPDDRLYLVEVQWYFFGSNGRFRLDFIFSLVT